MSHKESVLPAVSNWEPWRALSREGTKLDVSIEEVHHCNRETRWVGIKSEEEGQAGSYCRSSRHGWWWSAP